jgi:cyanophycinase-like exopeptidase
MMKGSLALVGSGEYLPAMLDLEKSLFEDGLSKGKEPVYVQIPTAAGRESRDRIKYWQELGEAQAKAMNVPVRFIPIFDREDALNHEFVSQIKDAALIYMSGGDPHHLANSLRDTPAGDAIIENWQSGGSLAGCSAGAMVMSSHVPNFRLSRSEPTAGLNIIEGVRVIPHFNKFFKWIPESSAKILLDVPEGSILLGIDELTALVKRFNNSDFEVFGEAKVHILKGMPNQQLAHSEKIKLLGIE